AVSLYKVFGPQVGALFGRAELLRRGGPIHPFVPASDVPYRYEVGGPNHPLVAGLPGIVDYLDALDHHHFAIRGDAGVADRDRVHALIADHEAALCARILGPLREARRVKIGGPTGAGVDERVAVIAFTVDGHDPRAITAALADAGIIARCGHFYAPEAIRALGIDARGVVRVSLAHYNTLGECDRLIAALTPWLG